MIRISERITVVPVTFGESRKHVGHLPQTGTVRYIHPKGRFCMVVFETGDLKSVKLRECFMLAKGEVSP